MTSLYHDTVNVRTAGIFRNDIVVGIYNANTIGVQLADIFINGVIVGPVEPDTALGVGIACVIDYDVSVGIDEINTHVAV